jgi:hypothetical protein
MRNRERHSLVERKHLLFKNALARSLQINHYQDTQANVVVRETWLSLLRFCEDTLPAIGKVRL